MTPKRRYCLLKCLTHPSNLKMCFFKPRASKFKFRSFRDFNNPTYCNNAANLSSEPKKPRRQKNNKKINWKGVHDERFDNNIYNVQIQRSAFVCLECLFHIRWNNFKFCCHHESLEFANAKKVMLFYDFYSGLP